MTVLFGGGEQNEFGMLSGVMSTGAGQFDPVYARCCLKPTADIGIQHLFDGDLAAFLAAQPAGAKDIWWGPRWRGGGGSFAFGNNVLTFYDTIGPYFRLICDGASAVKAQTSLNHGAAWTDYAGSSIAQPGAPAEYSFRMRLAAGDGRIEWWINQTLWWSYLGNTALMGDSPTKVVMGGANANGDSYFSEILATSPDQPRLGMRLCTLVPTADSAALDEWTGSFADIDEIVEDFSDSISTQLANKTQLFIVSDLPVLGSGVKPIALIISAKMQTQTSAPQNAQGVVRIGGVNYFGVSKPVSSSPANIQWIWQEDPSNPGNLFTEAVINGAELGVKSLA